MCGICGLYGSGDVSDHEINIRRMLSAIRHRGHVFRTLISDVPVGILLSGGLDSNGIAAIAAKLSGKPLRTFSIVFKEKTFDEGPYSQAMARYLGSEHHEIILDEDIMLDSLPDIAGAFDEPFSEGSAFPIYHICKCAKDYVTVILSGEGADEIFGGYEVYSGQQFMKYYRAVPAPVRALLRAAVHRLPVSDNWVSLDLKLRRFVDGALLSPPRAHLGWRGSFSVPSRQKLHGFASKIPLRDALRGIIPEDIRTRAKKGLNMPYQKWFKRKRWKTLLHDCLHADHLKSLGIFNSEGVRAMLVEHERGTHNHAHALWVTLNLVLWLKNNRMSPLQRSLCPPCP